MAKSHKTGKANVAMEINTESQKTDVYECARCDTKGSERTIIDHFTQYHTPAGRANWTCSLCKFQAITETGLRHHVQHSLQHLEAARDYPQEKAYGIKSGNPYTIRPGVDYIPVNDDANGRRNRKRKQQEQPRYYNKLPRFSDWESDHRRDGYARPVDSSPPPLYNRSDFGARDSYRWPVYDYCHREDYCYRDDLIYDSRHRDKRYRKSSTFRGDQHASWNNTWEKKTTSQPEPFRRPITARSANPASGSPLKKRYSSTANKLKSEINKKDISTDTAGKQSRVKKDLENVMTDVNDNITQAIQGTSKQELSEQNLTEETTKTGIEKVQSDVSSTDVLKPETGREVEICTGMEEMKQEDVGTGTCVEDENSKATLLEVGNLLIQTDASFLAEGNMTKAGFNLKDAEEITMMDADLKIRTFCPAEIDVKMTADDNGKKTADDDVQTKMDVSSTTDEKTFINVESAGPSRGNLKLETDVSCIEEKDSKMTVEQFTEDRSHTTNVADLNDCKATVKIDAYSLVDCTQTNDATCTANDGVKVNASCPNEDVKTRADALLSDLQREGDDTAHVDTARAETDEESADENDDSSDDTADPTYKMLDDKLSKLIAMMEPLGNIAKGLIAFDMHMRQLRPLVETLVQNMSPVKKNSKFGSK